MTNQTNWTIEVEEDPETGDLILPIPPEIITKLGWKEGDDLVWISNDDGSWYIQKKDGTDPA